MKFDFCLYLVFTLLLYFRDRFELFSLKTVSTIVR